MLGVGSSDFGFLKMVMCPTKLQAVTFFGEGVLAVKGHALREAEEP